MLDIEIRNRLSRYLSSQISLRELQEWFVPATWDVDQSPNQTARHLAYSIELRLAEYTSGHLSENELRHELLQFLMSYEATIEPGEAITKLFKVILSSSSRTLRPSPLERPLRAEFV
ncbi:MAG: hypothetical protein QOJ02_1718 [Acidobacteriota bacterium]|nr:hypothetical protein [Acidobacteriota bacterium]